MKCWGVLLSTKGYYLIICKIEAAICSKYSDNQQPENICFKSLGLINLKFGEQEIVNTQKNSACKKLNT